MDPVCFEAKVRAHQAGQCHTQYNKVEPGKCVVGGAIGTRAQAPIQTSQQAGPRSEREFPATHLAVVPWYDLSFHKASAEMHRS